VFVGPNVVFTDDPHPMNCPRYKECKGGAVVHRLARIGANATILPGVVIGENALVGAGSVVAAMSAGCRSGRQPSPRRQAVADLPARPASSSGPIPGPRMQARDRTLLMVE